MKNYKIVIFYIENRSNHTQSS